MEDLLIYFANFGWLPALLMLIGIGLLIVEMFLPGFSVPGITGVILVLFGIIVKTAVSGSLLEGVLLTLATLVILGIAFFTITRSFAKGRLSKSPIVLETATDSGSGYTSNADLHAYIGLEGVAATTLRPAGVVVINGERLDVVSDSEFIDEGSRVKVSVIEGRKVLVRRAGA